MDYTYYKDVCGIDTIEEGAYHRFLKRCVVGDWFILVPGETFKNKLANLQRAEVIFYYTARRPSDP